VTDINDPLMIGRIRAKVPDVTGDEDIGWAMHVRHSAEVGWDFLARLLSMPGSGSSSSRQSGLSDLVGLLVRSLKEVPSQLLNTALQKADAQNGGWQQHLAR